MRYGRQYVLSADFARRLEESLILPGDDAEKVTESGLVVVGDVSSFDTDPQGRVRAAHASFPLVGGASGRLSMARIDQVLHDSYAQHMKAHLQSYGNLVVNPSSWFSGSGPACEYTQRPTIEQWLANTPNPTFAQRTELRARVYLRVAKATWDETRHRAKRAAAVLRTGDQWGYDNDDLFDWRSTMIPTVIILVALWFYWTWSA